MAKTVLITGSSRGIGLALVKECVSLGHKVIATCRNPAGAKELNELLAQNSQPEAVKLDVDDHASIKEAFDKVKALTSGLDILINNAGIGTKNHPIDPPTTSEPDEMIHVFAVNVVGPMLVIQTFMPLLKKDEAARSVVANISSELASISGNSFGGINAYRCSKAALNMLTKNFSFEVPDVTFVSVHPGWVQTDLGSSNGRQPPVTQPESSAGIMSLLLGYKHEDTGKFFNWQGKEMQF